MSEETTEATETAADEPKVVIHQVDHVAAEQERIDAELEEAAAARRAAHVDGLKNELAYLERQPKEALNADRIGQVRAQLDTYAEKPKRRGRREQA